jgi:protein involved in polysaccharide export with SLBB domain
MQMRQRPSWRVWVGGLVSILIGVGCAIQTPTPTAISTLPASSARPGLLTISSGDVLEVIVRRGAGEDRFTSTVRDNGQLSVSFIDLDVKGLTALEAESRLTAALAAYVKEPRVQVLFKQKVVPDRFYVFGEVKKPGVFPMAPGMTIIEALGQADGYTNEAYLPSIRVLRGGLEQPQILAADVDQLLHKGDLAQNLLLKDQDIVYVPRSQIGDWNVFIGHLRPTLEALMLPLQSAILYKAIKN